jgi:hypothetical protein
MESLGGRKQYSSVLEMLEDISGKETAEEFTQYCSEIEVVKKLVIARCVAGLSEVALAVKMQCNLSRIKRIESSTDDQLRLGDVFDYLKAVNKKIIFSIEDNEESNSV